MSTIERSLEEKHHIEWQLHQSYHKQSQNGITSESESTGRLLNKRKPLIPLSRQLEDAFEGLYTNTYGTNMFCG